MVSAAQPRRRDAQVNGLPTDEGMWGAATLMHGCRNCGQRAPSTARTATPTSKRSPLTPAERKQILKIHGDGFTQLMIANQVGVHRHGVGNVVAKAGDATPADLRAEIARLKGELVKRDAELAALRRVKGPEVAPALRPVVARAKAGPTPAEVRALSAATPPREAPVDVQAAGIEAILRWHMWKAERHLGQHPVPCGPYGWWTEVRMRVWLARRRGQLAGVEEEFRP